MNDKELILNLKEGESYIVPESDYGRAEIWFKDNKYYLFEIPMYGGEPKFVESFPIDKIDLMINIYESWT